MIRNGKERLFRALRWSEKYTKTDMVYLARGGFFSAFSQAVGLVASLALAVAVSHFVPKESYGTYKYILSLITILSLFSLNSIGSAVFQSAAQGFDGALLKGFRENIRWSVAVFLGAFVLSIFYFFKGNNTLAIGVLIGGSFSPILASASLFGFFLGGKKDFMRQALYGIFDTTIPIVILIGAVMLTGNPVTLIATYFATNTLAALYFYRRTVKVYQARMHEQDEHMLSYSKHLSFMGIIGGIATNIDQILVFHFLGGAQLAIYNFAVAIPDQIKSPAKNIGAMLQPRLVARSGEDIKRGMNRKLLLMTMGSVAVTALYIVGAPFIFHALFPKYMEAVWYSQLYALWLLTISLDPVSTYLVARKLTKELYINTVVYSVVQITGVIIGVIMWGIAGVVLARVFTRVVIAGLNYALYHRAIAREISCASDSSVIR